MRQVLAILLLCIAATGCTRKEIVTIPPEAVSIPDPMFRNYCLTARDPEGNLSIDLDGDGIVTTAEAATVGEISLENEGGGNTTGVQSLVGIERFTGLRRLNIGQNDIAELDLSGNTSLTYLNCADNKLTAIDLSANTLLETVNCNDNDIAALDVSMLPALKYLYCTGNALTVLDVGGNPGLAELSCDRNELWALDVSGCSALTDLSCAGNGLTSISLPPQSALVRLDCGTNEHDGNSIVNELEELDLAGQDKISLLRANGNRLTALDISECASLRTLECVGCELRELDITTNRRLRLLFCNGNPEGMKIYVPAGFSPSSFLSWVIGTATVVEKN